MIQTINIMKTQIKLSAIVQNLQFETHRKRKISNFDLSLVDLGIQVEQAVSVKNNRLLPSYRGK